MTSPSFGPNRPPVPGSAGSPREPRPGAAATPARSVRLPSRRASAALAATMLVVGIAIGAAIGPSPERSFGSAYVPSLAPYIASLLRPPAAGAAPTTARASASPEAQGTPESTQSLATSAVSPSAEAGSGSESASASPSTTPSPSPGTTPSPGAGSQQKGSSGASKGGPAKTLPKIGHVWLIVLSSGQSFSSALRSPASAKFIDEALVGQGALLARYSAPAASELASTAAQLSQGPESGLTVIEEPSCSAPSSPCGSAEPAGLTRADGFLAEVVPQITASPAYAQNGALVITFGSTTQGLSPQAAAPTTPPSSGSSSTQSTPAHASSEALSAALPSHPAAGALVLSALVESGARLQQNFQPLDPRKSLERIFGG